MRRVLTPILLGVCLTGPGCSFVHEIKRNLISEPLYGCDEVTIRKRHQRLARQAWDEMAQQYGDCFSEDYRRGFIDGFVDYLTYGGCQDGCDEAPIVPAVPPERYRHKKYMTPEGYQAIEEWFIGFRHGSATAMSSGLRQLVVIPVMNLPVYSHLSAGRDDPRLPAGQWPGTTVPPPSLPPPSGEMLPTPRPIPPEAVPEQPGGLPMPPPGGGDIPPAPMPPVQPMPPVPPPF